MKTTPVCPILASFLALCSVASAENRGPGADRQRPGDHAARAAEMWKKVDLDADGAISRDEFDKMPRLTSLPEDKRQALFERLDKNVDGRLDRTEMNPGKQGPGQNRPTMPQIWDLDTDKDGSVSFDEFQAGRIIQRIDPEKQKRMFRHLDSDGDGKISKADKPKQRQRPEGGEGPRPGGDDRKPPKPGGLAQHLDKNGDGEVTLEEFSDNPRMKQLDEETIRKRFKMLDRNGDGKVDRSDFQRREGQGTRPRPRPGGPDKLRGGEDKPDGGAQVE